MKKILIVAVCTAALSIIGLNALAKSVKSDAESMQHQYQQKVEKAVG